MANEIIEQNQEKVYFKMEENSNYLVTDSYKNEYVIKYKQFEKMAKLLFDVGVDFITVNNIILNKRYIYKIEPTKKETQEDKASRLIRDGNYIVGKDLEYAKMLKAKPELTEAQEKWLREHQF
jgi:hypothetical protein